MKRWFAIFLLCLLVIAVGAAASLLWLREDRSQVAVTAETLEGDISAAEGFTAWQSAHMGRHLRWDLTIPLARPADTVAEYTYLEEELALSLRETAPLYFETGYLREENSPLEQVYKDVAARAPQLGPGETYTETVLLEGYLDAYPLYVYVYEQLAPAHGYSTFTVTAPAHKEIGRLMEDYFSFRAPSRDLYADLGLEFWDSYWNSCEVLWDGQRLAVAAITGPPFQTPTGLTLWIFRGGELLYQGSYTTSLNEETEQDLSHGESLEETLDKTVWILEGEGLSLGCDP